MGANISRRDFIKVSGGAIATGTVAGMVLGTGSAPETAEAAAPTVVLKRKAELPNPRGTRVVVVGGGWSGLTIAKYLKKEDPQLDVVLIESRSTFMSCPISNLWLAGLVDYSFLTYSFLDAARNNNYTLFNATVIDVDRTSRKVYTEQGYVGYDYLVLAPGIDYDYGAFGVKDPDDVFALKTHYPAAFKPGSEHLTLKNKIEDFDGGAFLLTVPSGNYRCLPAPYERACLVASVFKRNKVKGKVLLLDANPDIKIKKEGFHAAFNDLYKGYLEYVPSVTITGVDVGKRKIISEFDEYTFDDAAIYPRVRGAVLIDILGLVDPNSLQKEARIDPFQYNLVGDNRCYVAGDSRPMAFSKSGGTASSEGRFVAKVIAARAGGKGVAWESPHTICYSVVNAEPLEAITVDAHYAHDGERFVFDKVKMINARDTVQGQATLEWARGHYRDKFF